MDGWTDILDGWMGGRAGGRADGRTDGRTDGHHFIQMDTGHTSPCPKPAALNANIHRTLGGSADIGNVFVQHFMSVDLA